MDSSSDDEMYLAALGSPAATEKSGKRKRKHGKQQLTGYSLFAKEKGFDIRTNPASAGPAWDAIGKKSQEE